MALGRGLKSAVKALVPRGLIYATYEQRLLRQLDRDRLPEHVAVLADGNLYARDPGRFAQTSKALEQAQAALGKAEDQWLELEALREEIEG